MCRAARFAELGSTASPSGLKGMHATQYLSVAQPENRLCVLQTKELERGGIDVYNLLLLVQNQNDVRCCLGQLAWHHLVRKVVRLPVDIRR
jgi:hypothetical protein